MVTRQQEYDNPNNFISLSSSVSDSPDHGRTKFEPESSLYDSTHSLSVHEFQPTVGSADWLANLIKSSEEIFFTSIQEYLLEKEHCRTLVQRLKQQVQPTQQDAKYPLVFDMVTSPEVWNIPLSQAYISNKEQIYLVYPELHPRKVPNQHYGQKMSMQPPISVMNLQQTQPLDLS